MENPFQAITNDLSEIKNLLSNLYKQQAQPQKPEEDLTDVKGAANILKKAPGTVYNLVSENRIPHFKRGKKLYFSKEALLKYIHTGKIHTSNELKDEVNNTLHQQKQRNNSESYTLSERVKHFISTKDIDDLTNEEATEQASNIHYDVNANSIKKGQ